MPERGRNISSNTRMRTRRPASPAPSGAAARAPRNAGASATPSLRRNASFSFRRLFVLLSFALVALLILLAALWHVKSTYFQMPKGDMLYTQVQNGTYLEGVSIDGVNVSGMTFDEAYTAVLPSVQERLERINLCVKYDTTLWLLSAADIGAQAQISETLTEALLFGHSGTKAQNKETAQEVLAAGKRFTIPIAAEQGALSAYVKKIGTAINTPPIEPYAEPDAWAEKPTFIYHEGTDGKMLDEQELVADIMSAIDSGDYDTTLTVQLKRTPPEHSLDWIKQNTQLRSYWQTSFGGSSSSRETNRVGNIRKSTTILNGAEVDVGEEFNFNGYIGPRTEKGGWPLAPGIVNGNTYELQAGGGICQVSTTLYNALLCAGSEVEITERYHHSWPSSYADTGLDATVTGSVDSGKSLNFINNTGAKMYIFAYCNSADYTMTVYIYGEPLEEGVTYKTRGVVTETIEPKENTVVENPEWPQGYSKQTIASRKGYKSEVYRDKYVNGELVDSELLYTDSYRAVTGQTTVGTGDPSLPKPQ